MSIKPAEENELEVTDVIPFGIGGLDNLLCIRNGVAGLPRRRIVEVTGDFSLGKTTLCLLAVKQAQRLGLKCLWVDSEYAWDNAWAQNIGVDLKSVHLLHERIAEEALNEAEEAMEKGGYKLIIIDSIKRLVPREVLEKDNSGAVIGAQARLVTRFISKIGGLISEKNICVLVINDDFPNLTTMKLMCAGGRQLAKDKSIWIRLLNAQKPIKRGEELLGKTVKAEIRKNKLLPVERATTELQLLSGKGFVSEDVVLPPPKKRGRQPNPSKI